VAVMAAVAVAALLNMVLAQMALLALCVLFGG
jgi:hypothetical protein